MKKVNLIIIASLALVAINSIASAEELHPRARAVKNAIHELSQNRSQNAWKRANNLHNDKRASDSPGGDTPRMRAQREVSTRLENNADGILDIPIFMASTMKEETPGIISESAGQGSLANAWAAAKGKDAKKTKEHLKETNSKVCVGPGCTVKSAEKTAKSHSGRYAGDVRLPLLLVAESPIEIKMGGIGGETVENTQVKPEKNVDISRDETAAIAKLLSESQNLDKKIEAWSTELHESEKNAAEQTMRSAQDQADEEQAKKTSDAIDFLSN